MKQELEHLEDQLLVMDAQEGDAQAMDRLVRRWQKRLWQHAFRLTADPEAAWDITQQSWIGIIKGLKRLHDPEKFRAWAYQITTHKALNWIKKQKTERAVTVPQPPDIPHPQIEDTGLRELLEQLDWKRRIVLILYYFDELTVPEISIVLNIPRGTVKSRLHTGRRELKQMWQKSVNNETGEQS